VHQPGTGEVAHGVAAGVHADAEAGELVGDGRCDDVDIRAGIDESAGTAGRDRAATHDDDEPTGEIEAHGVGHVHGSAPAMPAATVAPVASSMWMNAPVRRLAA
jgi:hypothetical protein